MTRGAYSLDSADGPERIVILAVLLVLEGYDVWHDWTEPAAEPIVAEECWAFCGHEQPASWGPWECVCSPEADGVHDAQTAPEAGR